MFPLVRRVYVSLRQPVKSRPGASLSGGGPEYMHLAPIPDDVAADVVVVVLLVVVLLDFVAFVFVVVDFTFVLEFVVVRFLVSF